jgi:predicted site-specific integrase-resolvase
VQNAYTRGMDGELPLLLTARQAAALVGVDESTWNRWIREGRVPSDVIHPVCYGQPKRRRFSRVLIERWAAGELGC